MDIALSLLSLLLVSLGCHAVAGSTRDFPYVCLRAKNISSASVLEGEDSFQQNTLHILNHKYVLKSWSQLKTYACIMLNNELKHKIRIKHILKCSSWISLKS